MKKHLLLITGCCLLVTGAAHADPIDLYVGGGFGGGIGRAMHDGHSAYSYGVLAGVDLPIVRIEGEYNYLNYINDNNKSDSLGGHLTMANIYIRPLPTVMIVPYFGGGVGAAFGSDMRGSTAYQATLGTQVDIPATPIGFDLDARALWSEDAWDDRSDLLAFELRAKIRYKF